MRQILVTLNEDSATQSIRRAIGMLRGVASTSIYKGGEQTRKAYVKETLTRAVAELKAAKDKGMKMQKADDFVREFEESV
ncbi:hypothetical protein Prede_0722 [Prevotella dentalis DSM 3688]|uniref:Uncharacterized protein n=1 Tax=Prevotella dentalis (strain ATCC 49559 / DSM 3688 / JCM 13448 / NCTC 12043 / ES 2772) TaxID=908937 RepID=F9CZK6_PREDD|nr:hypothetical protein [Prevotella dentalis]AGB28076.1 hypothetical protein Prede_0722 [Prevotella dentalis DSM 3688]EGQ17689.1 hypothetical protein HMPREF9136_0033 [Prevotella dentalis DSM 3688]